MGEENTTEGFTEGFLNAHIRMNKDTLNMYAKEIREKCLKLKIDSSKYKNLPSISTREDYGPWIAFGNYLASRVELGKMEIDENLWEISIYYLNMAKTSHQAILTSAAKGLAKIVIDSVKKD